MQYETGRVVDRYVIEGFLGAGGMAEVYRVRHTRLGTSHALKLLTIASKSIRERLLREGQVQAHLRHPNIVPVTDVIDVDGAPALILEFIDGPTLEGMCERWLDVQTIDELARGVLAGVAEAHRQGLIHRDLKPGNVLLDRSTGRLVPRVTDFGLAKALGSEGGSTATRTGSTMGTPRYMSPEQIRDVKSVDARADVFSLGALLYELCTSRPAFEGDDLASVLVAVRDARYVPPETLRPDLPARMRLAIDWALRSDRDERPVHAGALLAMWTAKDAELPERPPPNKTPAAPTWDDEGKSALIVPSSGPTLMPDSEPADGPRPPREAPVRRGDPSDPMLVGWGPPVARAPTPVMRAPTPVPAPPVDSGDVFQLPLGPLEPPSRPMEAPLFDVADIGDPAPPPLPARSEPRRRGGNRVREGPLRYVVAMAVLVLAFLIVLAAAAQWRWGTSHFSSTIADPQAVAALPTGPTWDVPAGPHGTLHLLSDRVAAVTLDGKTAGDTRAFQHPVTAGVHHVKMSASSVDLPATLDVTVADGETVVKCWSFAYHADCTKNELQAALHPGQ